MLMRVGPRATEIEYRIHIIRLWNGAWMSFAGGLAVIARIFNNWAFLAFAIAAYLFGVLLTVRIFILRHQFFQAASEDLGTKVNMRHPVRGYPNWRRQLSDEQLHRLDEQYDAWCAKRGINGLRQLSQDEILKQPE